MRIFELLVIITMIASAINLVLLKNKKINFVLPASSILLCIVSMIFEGYRLQMLPAYLLAFILFVISVINKFTGTYKVKKIFKFIGIPLLILSIIISVVFPALFPVAKLPAPDGEYSVGTMNMSFTDKMRKGIFAPSNHYRDIAVQVWYPADDTKNKKVANFMSERKMSTYLAQSMQFPNFFDHLSLVKTHSYINAKISNKESKYPILLFSAGFLGFVGQNAALMEELASQGYIVFGVSHPYEDFVSVFPKGDLVPFNTQQVNSALNELNNISKGYTGDTTSADFEKYQIKNAKIMNNSIHIWSDDIKFIATKIEELNCGVSKSIFKDKLDTSNMGVFGHSFGGAAAGQVCLEDDRFKGFINMDGAPFGDSVNTIIEQPFMILNGDRNKNLIKAGYSSQQKNYIDVTIHGAKHIDFTDLTVLLPAYRYMGILGDIGGDLQEEIVKDYVTSFFNKYLKGTNEPLIDKELQKYSKVTVELN